MPIYEYRCDKCGDVFEVRQKFSDSLLTTHENCGGNVTKMLSAPAFQFKGTGWYVTDYARGGNSNKAEGKDKESKDKKDGGTSGDKGDKKEAKPAAESKPAPAASSDKS